MIPVAQCDPSIATVGAPPIFVVVLFRYWSVNLPDWLFSMLAAHHLETCLRGIFPLSLAIHDFFFLCFHVLDNTLQIAISVRTQLLGYSQEEAYTSLWIRVPRIANLFNVSSAQYFPVAVKVARQCYNVSKLVLHSPHSNHAIRSMRIACNAQGGTGR